MGAGRCVYDADRGRVSPRLSNASTKLAWSDDGRLLLSFSPHRTRVYAGSKVVAADDPSDATADRDAAFAGDEVFAAREAGDGSNVFSLSSGRTVFRGTGLFDQLAASPDGRWLLVELADREPVGVRPAAPKEDHRRLPNRAAVRALGHNPRMVLRGLIVAGLVAVSAAAAAPQPVVIGHSVRGRPIVAFERGDPSAPATLVVGVIHGSEPAGLAVISQLRHLPLPPGVHLWLVPTVNPDGLAAGTRQNAHGVDLNRNWPTAWKHNGVPWDGYYSGPRPMSEPENRAMRAFILRVKPALTIWYHQPLDVVYGSDPHVAVLKHYARLSGLPYRRLTAPRGAATRWQRRHFPSSPAFVVEFPAGRISTATARRNAKAVLALSVP